MKCVGAEPGPTFIFQPISRVILEIRPDGTKTRKGDPLDELSSPELIEIINELCEVIRDR
jgi:hypothetical protein